jgi:O-antigen/teichoic acid export membrane protein
VSDHPDTPRPPAVLTSDESSIDASLLSDEQVGRRVIQGGAQRAAGFFAANLFTAASAVILLRYLGVDAFGRYGTVLALVGIVYGISDLGLTATGTRELALCETLKERHDVLAHILGLRILVTGLGVLAATAFAAVSGYESVLIVGTALAGFGVLLQSVQAAMLIPLSVQLRNGVLALNQILTQGVLLLGVGLLAGVGAGLGPFFAVQILIGLALLAAAPVMLSRQHLVAPRWTTARIRALAAVALPVAVGTVLGVLYLRLLVIIMSLLSDEPSQLGYFVTSTRVLELVGGIPFLVISIVLPVVTVAARDDHARLVYITSRVAQVMALGGVLVALLLWILSGPIVTVLGGHQYAPAGSVLEIQGFATITIFLTAAWQPALMAMDRLRSFMIAMTIGVLSVVVAALLLIPRFEADGAAVAAVVGDVTLALAMYVAVRRAGPGDWLPAALPRVAAAAIPAVGVGLITAIPAGVRAAVVAAVFLGLAAVFGAVPSEVADAVRTAAIRLRIAARP